MYYLFNPEPYETGEAMVDCVAYSKDITKLLTLEGDSIWYVGRLYNGVPICIAVWREYSEYYGGGKGWFHPQYVSTKPAAFEIINAFALSSPLDGGRNLDRMV